MHWKRVSEVVYMRECSVTSVKCVASYMSVRPTWLPFLFIRLAALAEVNRQPRADAAPIPDPSKDVRPSSSGSGVTSGT